MQKSTEGQDKTLMSKLIDIRPFCLHILNKEKTSQNADFLTLLKIGNISIFINFYLTQKKIGQLLSIQTNPSFQKLVCIIWLVGLPNGINHISPLNHMSVVFKIHSL